MLTSDLSAQAFYAEFPQEVIHFLRGLWRRGFVLTLVGGAVRSYVQTGKLGNDLDFELRSRVPLSQGEWREKLKELEGDLKKEFQDHAQFLRFSVLRVSLGSFQLEMAPARVESYRGVPPFGHDEFEVELLSCPDYRQSFRRRDFTVNAIGIELEDFKRGPGEINFIDPFDGLEDLKQKKLKMCSKDFFYDPVRFLRLVRFSSEDQWDFDGELLGQMTSFNLKKLGLFHFFGESFKASFWNFGERFFNLVEQYQIPLSQECLEMSFLKDCGHLKWRARTREEVFLCLAFEERAHFDKELKTFAHYAQIKKNFLKKYLNLRESFQSLSHLSWENLIEKTKKEDFILFEDRDIEGLKIVEKIRQFLLREKRENILKLKEINPQLSSLLVGIEEM